MLKEQRVSHLVVVVRDVTRLEAVAHAERVACDRSALFDAAFSDPGGVAQRLADGDSIAERLRCGKPGMGPLIHTLKGLCATVHLSPVVETCHRIEEAVSGLERDPSAEECASHPAV